MTKTATGWTASALAAIAMLTPATPAVAQAAGPGAWWGRYVYEHDGGQTAGGSGIAVTHVLNLKKSSCRLEASGFQTDETIVCRARVDGTGVVVSFAGYPDGGTRNKYGVAQYRTGGTLFSMRKTAKGIVTTWGDYSPVEDGQPRVGRYFRPSPR